MASKVDTGVLKRFEHIESARYGWMDVVSKECAGCSRNRSGGSERAGKN